MSEPLEEGIFREIDEELRQENFAKLWKRYGNFIVGGAVALIVAVGGYQGWHTYDLNSRMAQSEQYAAAARVAQVGSAETALEKLKALRANGDSGYRLLAAFDSASLLARKGDNPAAVAAFDSIANNEDNDSIYRDLARLLAVTVLINSNNGQQGLLTRLQPLTDSNNPWQHSARELLAVIAEQGGDKEKSRSLFKSLSEDATAPQGIRQRAGEMLAALGGK